MAAPESDASAGSTTTPPLRRTQTPGPPRVANRAIASFILLAGVTVLAVATWAAAPRLAESSSPGGRSVNFSSTAQPTDVSNKTMSPPAGDNLLFNVWVNGLDVATSKVNATIVVMLGDSILATMYNLENKQPFYPEQTLNSSSIQPSDSTVTLSVDDSYSRNGQVVEFPLTDMLPRTLGGRGKDYARIPISMSVIGTPGSYPNDQYSAEVIIGSLHLPKYVARSSISMAPPRIFADLALTTGMNGFHAEYLAQQNVARFASIAGFVSPLPYAKFSWKMERDVRSVTFIYVLSLVPLCIVAVMVHLTLTARELDSAMVLQLIVGLAAVLFTVLPLRIVLVPGGIGGLTRLDYVLGLMMAILLLAGIASYWMHFWRISRSRRSLMRRR